MRPGNIAETTANFVVPMGVPPRSSVVTTEGLAGRFGLTSAPFVVSPSAHELACVI